MNAYAAYRRDYDWIALSSIRLSPEAVEQWINKTYVSRSARENFVVIQIRIKRLDR